MKNVPKLDESYWREQIARRPYYDPNVPIDKYLLALSYGWSARGQIRDRRFEDAASELQRRWESTSSGLSWEHARAAVEDAWERADELLADAVSMKGEFTEPPTFTEHGTMTPRGIDEPNQ